MSVTFKPTQQFCKGEHVADCKPASHDCHTTDPQARINTDCGHKMRTTDPSCTGCVMRNDE